VVTVFCFDPEGKMSIQIEIPEKFFPDDQEKSLKLLFNIDPTSPTADKDFKDDLTKVVLAALDEYRDMFLGMGLPSRASEVREFRLYHLIKRFFDKRIPDELNVSSMFQLPQSRAKSLILYVLTRFRYDLEEEIVCTLKDIVISAEHVGAKGVDEYRVFIGCENMVDELNRIIAKRGSFRLKPLSKVRDEPNLYWIAADSYRALREHLGLK
jgi:hypothetical protein